jgi:hypothetical protein
MSRKEPHHFDAGPESQLQPPDRKLRQAKQQFSHMKNRWILFFLQ